MKGKRSSEFINGKIISVPDILCKSAHIGGQGLECIITCIINRNGLIEGLNTRINIGPVINASKIIDKGCMTERSAGSKTICPDQRTVNLQV